MLTCTNGHNPANIILRCYAQLCVFLRSYEIREVNEPERTAKPEIYGRKGE